MSNDLAALKAKARSKHNNRGRCFPRRTCFECREVYPCLTIRLLDENERLRDALQLWEKFAWYATGGSGHGPLTMPLWYALVFDAAKDAGRAFLANDPQEAAP